MTLSALSISSRRPGLTRGFEGSGLFRLFPGEVIATEVAVAGRLLIGPAVRLLQSQIIYARP